MKIILLMALVLGIGYSKSVASDYLSQFRPPLETKYFSFYFKRNEMKICQVARFADHYIALIDHDFFKADFEFPIRVVVLEDQEHFGEFLKKEFNEQDPPGFGEYFSREKAFVTYETSGLGTFTHEILHPLVEKNLKDRPGWAMEGIPTFFEKFFGYWDGDKLVIHWGYQNPWRIAGLGENLKSLDLNRILASSGQGEFRESDMRLVSIFLWESGKFHRFLQLIQEKNKGGFSTYFEAAFGVPVADIIPLWKAYLDKVYAQRDAIKRIPPSTILPDKMTFEAFMKHFGLEYKTDSESSFMR